MCEMQPTVVIKFSLQKKTSERPAIYIFAMQRDEINGDWDEIVIIFVIDQFDGWMQDANVQKQLGKGKTCRFQQRAKKIIMRGHVVLDKPPP